MTSSMLAPHVMVGWREWLALPELGISQIKTKIDTGARTSCLHVESWEIFYVDQVRWVRFKVFPQNKFHARAQTIQCPIFDERIVTDSGGHRSLRIFIRTLLAIGKKQYAIEINLTNRRNMLFPMLLGRTAMQHHIQIHPEQSYLLGKPLYLESNIS